MCFLFVDRILQRSEGVVRGVKHITRDDPYLTYDVNGRLCFIPSLIGETLGQLAAWEAMHRCDFLLRPVAGVVGCAKLHRPVYVGETLSLESVIDHLDKSSVQYHSIARVGDETVFTIDDALGPLLPMEEFIDVDLVRRQFAEIDRPGEWPPKEAAFDPIGSEGAKAAVPMLFDSLLAHEPGVLCCAEKRITRSAAYFPDHFPNKAVLPMTVLLECKLNLAREFVAQAGFAVPYHIAELRKIKMNEFVYPGDTLVCHMKVKHRDAESLILQFRSEVNGKRVCVLELVMCGNKGC